ncbi:MAG: hypothetical protein ABFS16_02860 [Bacteroidota bacterium]
MTKYLFFFLLVFGLNYLNAQPVEIQADYDAVGDCIFSANNNSKAPMYLHINFADLQNTSFSEPLPYVKRLTPGFNSLFTLYRDLDADVPRFNYEIKSFRSDPMADVDLDFPYLIPFEPGRKVQVFDVENIDGFWGAKGLKSWSATGFKAKPGDIVYASRNGIIVEIAGATRTGNSENWYNTWTNSVTVLQPDGTLICYHNVVDKAEKLKVGEKIFTGQSLGEIASRSNSLIVLIYHDSLYAKGLSFVIPQFVVAEGKKEIVNSSTEYSVAHPVDIRSLEMSKKERKKILGKKR